MRSYFSAATAVVCLFGAVIQGFGQYPVSFTGCENLTADDFEQTFLFTHTSRNESEVKHESMHNLIRFDLLKNGDDYDIYYGGFEGVLYRYNNQNKQITAIKDFETIQGSVNNQYGSGDHGVTGVKFHPDFETNRWVFIFYTPKVENDQNRVMLLSRFNLSTNFQLENEKVLLRMEATTTDKWHSGGDMYFNAQGDLFLQVGDNVANDGNASNKTSNAAWTSGNTTNVIGGVVRIHPDNSEKGYSIPKGNFGEHFGDVYNDQEFMNPTRVMPEIFAKGQRSNFTATGHPTELIHIWGEVSTGGGHDEVNIVDAPVYSGWPHYQGNEEEFRTGGSNNRYEHDIADRPLLDETTAGSLAGPDAITELPHVYEADMVMGGAFNVVWAQALYYYGKGPAIVPGRTFPPHLHETFIFGRFNGGDARIVPLVKGGDNGPTAQMMDDDYNVIDLLADGNNKVFTAVVEAKYGPDGALYVMARGGSYGSPKGLMTRIDYKGSCQDQALYNANREAFVAAEAQAANPDRYREGHFDPALYTSIHKSPVRLMPSQELTVRILDVRGKLVGSYKTMTTENGHVSAWNGKLGDSMAPEGVYLLRFQDGAGKVLFSQKQVR